MSAFRCVVDGVTDLRRTWRLEVTTLRGNLARETHRAAKAGVRAAKDTHPYTDRTGQLTGTATVEMLTVNGEATALMQWPMTYASFVNLGTRRARPYPFTPHAERTTESLLEQRARFHVTSLIVAFL